jgi:hypothetical protein
MQTTNIKHRKENDMKGYFGQPPFVFENRGHYVAGIQNQRTAQVKE